MDEFIIDRAGRVMTPRTYIGLPAFLRAGGRAARRTQVKDVPTALRRTYLIDRDEAPEAARSLAAGLDRVLQDVMAREFEFEVEISRFQDGGFQVHVMALHPEAARVGYPNHVNILRPDLIEEPVEHGYHRADTASDGPEAKEIARAAVETVAGLFQRAEGEVFEVTTQVFNFADAQRAERPSDWAPDEFIVGMELLILTAPANG